MRGGRAAELAVVAILGLGTWLALATSGLPRVVPPYAPPGEFSAVRTEPDLERLTAAPHSLASAEHDRLRDYLVDRLRALGLDDVHVQSATGFNTLLEPRAATVANIVGRKRGTGGGPAILLEAHYDAVPRSPGAGDDGAAIAAILGTLDALSHGAPLQRDLIVAFLDAEEEGLLGAEAFVNLHPWAREVGVVLNFDGRGNTGPVYMFQTSRGNAPLIKALAQVPGARTNSLTGEVYRHLPSDTDLSIWLHSNFPVGALNFAHVAGFTHYHTPSDNIVSLDRRVVQQMGNYALSLTRTLGNMPLDSLQTDDAIYFDAPIVGVVRYPGSWALILAIDGATLALVLIGVGFYRRTITLRGALIGALSLAITLVIPFLLATGLWRAVKAIHPGYREILQRDPYNSLWYLLAVGAFTVAIGIAAYNRARRRASPVELAAAPLLLWTILGIVIALVLPGASYLTAWPLFAMTLGGSWWRRTAKRERTPSTVLALLALPVLVLLLPLVKSLEVALTAEMLPLAAVLVALVISAITLPLELAGSARRWIALGCVVVGGVALIVAETTAGFTVERKRPNSLSRVIDADSSRAWWVSFDHATDEWTARALGTTAAQRDFNRFGLMRGGATLLASQPEPAVAPQPPVMIVDRQPVSGGQRVHLRVARSGMGDQFRILVDTAVAVSQVVINGRALVDGSADRYLPRYVRGERGEVLHYYGVPPEGVDLWLTLTGSGPLALRVVTYVDGLPDAASGPLPPRPAITMSKPFVPTDMTITGWTIPL